jgi:hypothetical protein
MTSTSRANAPDREGRADKVGDDKDRRHSEDEVVVFAHSRCLTAMAAAMIHAMPPKVPIAEPIAAS